MQGPAAGGRPRAGARPRAQPGGGSPRGSGRREAPAAPARGPHPHLASEIGQGERKKPRPERGGIPGEAWSWQCDSNTRPVAVRKGSLCIIAQRHLLYNRGAPRQTETAAQHSSGIALCSSAGAHVLLAFPLRVQHRTQIDASHKFVVDLHHLAFGAVLLHLFLVDDDFLNQLVEDVGREFLNVRIFLD